MIFGADIPDGLIYGVVPVVLMLIVGLIAWIVRELGRISVQNGRAEERFEDHERRLASLEGRRDR